MANLLKETSRVIEVTATYSDDNNRYDVNYKTTIDGKSLQKLNMSIYRVKDNVYMGEINQDEKGLINTNFNDSSISLVDMANLFSSIVNEVKAGLTA